MGLTDLFRSGRAPDSVVARRWDSDAGGDRNLTWADFGRDVASLHARLKDGAPGPWLLVTEDAYAFTVGLFALWHSGRWAVCPPNHQPGTLHQLQTSTAGIVSDRPDWFPDGATLHALAGADAGVPLDDPASWPALDADAPALQLFTSGTTGEGKPISKSLRHLDVEAQVLETLWGERVGDAEIFGTSSHQHLYGLSFRIMWPLFAGRPFRSDVYLHTRELVPRMLASGRCALASVPTHLKRMVRQPDIEDLRAACRTTFSSGGMLPAETAREWREAFGEAPIEILGSTETGGVAWRQDPGGSAGSPSWTALPRVDVSLDERGGRLRVRSPFVSAGDDDGGFTMGDRAEIGPDGGFRLLGRADRVVKVAEKRLDLARMESDLRANPLVDEVALLLLEQDNDARVAAVVVPTADGRAILDEAGRTVLGRVLSESLANDWDRVLLPRLWRTVDALPENAQGKTTTAALQRLFHGSDRTPSSPDRPTVLDEHVAEDSIEQLCAVPQELRCLPDHFPGFPIVPGVMQVDWALDLATTLFGSVLDVREIGALKFRAPLGPGVTFRLKVERTGRETVAFRVWNDDHEFASGRARVASGGGPAA